MILIMNYYIQGSPSRAEEIKAAFEKLGCDTTGWTFNVEGGFYYTHDGRIDLACDKFLINLIKTHPDYKELELPKPHYDIANLQPFDKVLVRDEDTDMWTASLYSNYDNFTKRHFVSIDSCYSQCVPFEGNEHLLGTTDPCDECYINW